jgi:DnaK suppressor protein
MLARVPAEGEAMGIPVQTMATIRDRLSGERAALRAELLALQDRSRLDAWSDAFSDMADAGAAVRDREAQGFERRGLDARLARVERALERMTAGTYGTCEVCGAAIPDERLDVLPATVRCVSHV